VSELLTALLAVETVCHYRGPSKFCYWHHSWYFPKLLWNLVIVFDPAQHQKGMWLVWLFFRVERKKHVVHLAEGNTYIMSAMCNTLAVNKNKLTISCSSGLWFLQKFCQFLPKMKSPHFTLKTCTGWTKKLHVQTNRSWKYTKIKKKSYMHIGRLKCGVQATAS